MRTTASQTIKTCLQDAEKRLNNLSDSAALDAQVLLALALTRPRSYFYTWPDKPLTSRQVEQFDALIERRMTGEPVAYITGNREFWGLPLSVTSDTLIPRPETERLVEIALHHIPENKPWRIADLGTGCGAIALAIASERPTAIIDATDVSESTLAVALKNQSALAFSNVRFRAGSWFEAFNSEPRLTSRFHFIISNPPYVAENDPHLRQGDLRFEPQWALCSGKDGLKDLSIIIHAAREHLLPGAYLLLEHGFDQADAVADIFETAGYSQVNRYRDYAKQERATIGRWQTLEYSD